MAIKDLFWERVDGVLKRHSISVSQLSKITSISYDSFKSWRSKKRIPDAESLVSISNALKVSIDYLLKGTACNEDLEDPILIEVKTNSRLRNIVISCINNPDLIEAFEIMTNSSSLHSKEIENLQESSPLHPKKSTG